MHFTITYQQATFEFSTWIQDSLDMLQLSPAELYISKLTKDSIYIGTCAENLEGMLKKYDKDKNHYIADEVEDEMNAWKETKSKFFVIGTSIEEKRTPLLWKEEYSTRPDAKGELIALSWYLNK